MLSVDEIMERSQWDLFFVPPETRVVDRPELLYTVTARDIPHLNCVSRTRLDDGNRDAAVEEVSRAHASVTSEWLVQEWLGDDAVGPVLARHGYEPKDEHRAYALRTDASLRAPAAYEIRRVETLKALEDGERVFGRAFDNREAITDENRAQRLEQCASPDGRVHRFVVYDAGEPISYGAMTLFHALGFAVLWRGGTVPEARGRGAYRALLKERMRFAKQKGIAMVGLYAKLDTSAPIVDALGFEAHGRMTFWNRDPSGRIRPRLTPPKTPRGPRIRPRLTPPKTPRGRPPT